MSESSASLTGSDIESESGDQQLSGANGDLHTDVTIKNDGKVVNGNTNENDQNEKYHKTDEFVIHTDRELNKHLKLKYNSKTQIGNKGEHGKNKDHHKTDADNIKDPKTKKDTNNVAKSTSNTEIGTATTGISGISSTVPNAQTDLTGDDKTNEFKKKSRKTAERPYNETTRVIHVKEQKSDVGVKAMKLKHGNKKEITSRPNKTHFKDHSCDSYESDYDKYTDSDSGVEDEEILDVILTGEQQEMIIGILFDENMDLRPEFGQDENGRIIVSIIFNKISAIVSS